MIKNHSSLLKEDEWLEKKEEKVKSGEKMRLGFSKTVLIILFNNLRIILCNILYKNELILIRNLRYSLTFKNKIILNSKYQLIFHFCLPHCMVDSGKALYAVLRPW